MKVSFLIAIRWLLGLAGLMAAAAIAHAAPPAGTVGVAYSYQTTTPTAGTVYSATDLPPGLGIGSSSGLISGTPTTAGTYSGVISVTADSVTNNLSYTIVINAGAGTPVITSAATASGTVGTAFTAYTPVASPAATSFNVTGLPAGLAADPTVGTISGTPTAAGTSAVTISGNNASGTGAAFTLTITVAPAAGTPVINSAAALSGLPGVAITPFQVTTVAANATSYAVSGLPLGLAIDPATGIISGTPSVAGVSAVTLTAANGNGTGAASTLTVTIGAVITNSATASGTVGSAFSLQLTGSPSGPITSFNVTGLPTGLTATAGGLISGTPTAAAGTYALTVSANTAGGTGPSSTLALTLAAASVPGGGGGGTITATITTQPAAVTVAVGGTANFAVTATSSSGGSLTYQWLFAGAAINGQTSSTLSLTNVQAANGGLYSVVVTAVGGTSVTSTAALLTVTTAAPTPVTITTQPVSQSVGVGGSVTFTVAASGSGTLTYQWSKNGVPISGATSATYTINTLSGSDAASYTVTASNGSTSAGSAAAVLTVTTPVAVTRLINVSILGFSGAAPQNLVVGLSIGGAGSKSALIRAVGPGLSPFGVPGVMADPQLTVVNGSTQVGFDDDWGGGSQLSEAFAQTGAFGLPVGSKDAAILLNLAAGSTYTANVAGAGNSTGVVLLEAYDADTSATPTARFINLSARGVAGAGSNVMTIGFVISGTANKTILLRGIGPSLAGFGLTGVLPTTQLTLFSGQTAVSTNSGWGGAAALSAAFTQVGAFQLSPASQDSALLLNLAPGTYTAQLTGAGGSTASGVALLELYDVQ